MTVPTDARAASGRSWPWRVVAVLAVLLACAGLAATLVRPLAPPVPEVVTPLTTFDEATLRRVAGWVGPLRVAFLLRLALGVLVPVLLVGTARGRRLVARLAGVRLATARAAAVVVAATLAAGLPLDWWIGWQHAGVHGFRVAGPVRWTVETLGGHALTVLVTTVGALVLLAVLRRWPDHLAPVGTIAATLLTAALVLAQPLVVARVLYDPRPLDDPALEAAIDDVVARSTVEDVRLLEARASVRTTRVNAFVTGVGPSRQVLLWDTLLALPQDRVVAVVGHELAHAEHRDVARSVLATATATLALLLPVQLLRRRRPDLVPATGARAGALAVAAVLVVQVASVPVVGWTSRRLEAAADHRSLELVRDPAGLVEVTRGFVEDDLADPDPPAWVRLLTTHPPPADRIAAAVAWARANGVAVPGDNP